MFVYRLLVKFDSKYDYVMVAQSYYIDIINKSKSFYANTKYKTKIEEIEVNER